MVLEIKGLITLSFCWLRTAIMPIKRFTLRFNKTVLCLQLIFREGMLVQFVNVFLQALVFRSHDILQEEITVTLYNMAAVDFESFYTSFLPQFLAGCQGLTDSQKSELGKNFAPDKVRSVF